MEEKIIDKYIPLAFYHNKKRIRKKHKCINLNWRTYIFKKSKNKI